jgi:hypothetical protein
MVDAIRASSAANAVRHAQCQGHEQEAMTSPKTP